jgi:hypothetical protein
MSGNVMELSCAKCGSNRLRFPPADEDPVTCEDCGAPGQSLRDVKESIAGRIPGEESRALPEKRSERRERHTSEVEASQTDLRNSVAETDRLVDESDRMLRRHRKECDDEETKGA